MTHDRRQLIATVLAALLAAGCAARGAGGATADDWRTQDEAGARAFLAEYARLGAAGQLDSLAALYDDGPAFSWVESGRVVARSRAEIRQGLSKLPPGTGLDTRFDPLAVQLLAPGAALVTTTSHSTFRTLGTGAAIASFSTTLTMVLVRTEAGWRIRHGHASNPPR